MNKGWVVESILQQLLENGVMTRAELANAVETVESNFYRRMNLLIEQGWVQEVAVEMTGSTSKIKHFGLTRQGIDQALFAEADLQAGDDGALYAAGQQVLDAGAKHQGGHHETV